MWRSKRRRRGRETELDLVSASSRKPDGTSLPKRRQRRTESKEEDSQKYSCPLPAHGTFRDLHGVLAARLVDLYDPLLSSCRRRPPGTRLLLRVALLCGVRVGHVGRGKDEEGKEGEGGRLGLPEIFEGTGKGRKKGVDSFAIRGLQLVTSGYERM